MVMKSDANEFLTCPYEESHSIAKCRMARHLIKCEKSHPNIKLEECPYNILHRIKPIEFEHHLSICEDRISCVSSLYQTESARSVETVTVEEVNSIAVPLTENWDMEPGPIESYDPLRNLETKNILHASMCLSKAKRKEFKQQERNRHNAISNEASTSPPKTHAPKSGNELEQPLRLPRVRPQALAQNEMKSDSTVLQQNGITTENKVEKIDKKNTSRDTINKKLKEKLKQESKYMDEDLIVFTKAIDCIDTNDTSTNNDENIESVLNTTAETSEHATVEELNGLQRNNDKRCSAGRGISRIFDMYKKSGASKEALKSYFLNSKRDTDSMKKDAKTQDYNGAFYGYAEEESNLNLKELEDELSSIGGYGTE